MPDALTRRRVLHLGILSAAASLVAACQTAATPAAQPPTPAPTRPASGGTASAVPVASPSAAAASAPAQGGGILRFGLSDEPGSLDPHVTAACPSVSVYSLVYSNVVRWTADGKLVGDLADSWRALDDRRFEVKLKPTATFHDGSPVTAADVAFSFNRILDPATSAYQRSVLQAMLEGVQAMDAQTAQFTLKAPNNAFPAVLADRNMYIVSKSFVESGNDLKTRMLGSGPFRFTSYEPGVALKLERYGKYALASQPALEGVTFTPLKDETARMSALRSGSVDFVDYVPARDMASIEKNSSLRLYSNRSQLGQRMVFNLKQPPYDNLQVRQALNYAIDREAIVRSALLGRGDPVPGSRVKAGHWGHDDSLASVYPYDPAKAKSMLAEAGFPTGFKTRLLTTATFGFYKDASTVVQANLKDVGVDAELELVEFATLVARQTKGQFELLQSFFTGQEPGDYLVAYGAGQPQNFGGFDDTGVTRSLEDALATSDAGRRREAYVAAQRRVLELAPDIPLVFREQGEASVAKLTGYENLAASICQGKTLDAARLAH